MESKDTPYASAGPQHAYMPSQPYRRVSGRMHASLVVVGAVVLLLFLGLSWQGSRLVRDAIESDAMSVFEKEVDTVQRALQTGLEDHVQVLYSLRGLFLASAQVDAEEWDAFVQGLDIIRRFPGMAFVAYAERVPASKRSLFEEQHRIFPPEERDEYMVMTVVTARDRDLALLGWDVSAEYGASFQRVRDAGELSSVGRMEHGDYLFALPVYRQGEATDSVRERRSAHQGFIVLGLRPSLFLSSQVILHPESVTTLAVSLLDEREALLYEQSIPQGFRCQDILHPLQRSTFLHTAGLVWILRICAPSSFGLTDAQVKFPLLLFLGGAGFSLLVFTVFYLIVNSRIRALRLAARMTSELGKFQLAVRHASNHIVITDPDGVILYANPASERLTGYSREEMLGQTPKLWGKQMPPEFYQRFWKRIKEDRLPFDGEILNRRKDGVPYDALIHVSPILGHEQKLFGFVGIEEDITSRKQLERARSEFVSLASHQLRTPLTAMRLTMDTLLSGALGALTGNQEALLQRAKEYGVHMAETIFTMLTISHVEAGKVTVQHSAVDICVLLRELEREYGNEIRRKEQQYTVECPPNTVLQTDAKLLREVFANLLSNATKYTPDRGSIRTTIREEDGHLRIDVSDTGYGIPAHQQDRVFHKFFRGENIMKRSTDGTGLGLYLVASLTTLLGGYASFQSQENVGTTFSLFLPLTPSSHGSNPRSGEDHPHR